jgi:uncharacterized protein involved in exopolysaccharide biosynthesis
MEQIAMFDVMRRRASLILALTMVAAVAGYAFSFLIPDRYTASALVLVRPQQPIKMGGVKESKEFLDFPVGNTSAVETASKTYIEIIKSPALIGEVVRELGLDKEKAQEQAGSGESARLLPVELKQSLNGLIAVLKYGRLIEDDPFTAAVKEVTDSFKLEAYLDTYIFDIKYVAKNPQRAADVANATAKALIQFVDGLRVSEARYQRDHLKTELEQRQRQLNAARERLESYKKTHSIFLYESEYDAKLKVISELEVALAKAEEALVGSQNTLSTVSLAARRARLVRSLNEQKAELVPLPGIERELKQLELDVKTADAAYQIVDKEFQEADIKNSYAMPEIGLVSEAVVPRLPSSPRRGYIALASLVGGLVVALGLAFFLEYLNRRIRGIHDIEDFVGVKVLATIPRISRRQWRHAGLL